MFQLSQLSQLSLLSLILSLAALSVSGQTVLRFEGGADLSAWINELEFEHVFGSFYRTMDTQYNIFKSECTMNGGAVQWFWTIIDLGVSNLPIPSVAGQNICDRAIVRCRSSETASLQSCDGRWAFKQDRGEPGTNPFVVVGTVITSFGSTAGSTGSAGGATEEVQEETEGCFPLMEMSGHEVFPIDGIEWQMIHDPARDHGEAD
eukprot:112274_1